MVRDYFVGLPFPNLAIGNVQQFSEFNWPEYVWHTPKRSVNPLDAAGFQLRATIATGGVRDYAGIQYLVVTA
jgi:hypothetical protein